MDGTVLIADDDDAVRKVLSQALTRAGCRVHATSLLATLSRWVKEGKGDVVISDVVMPDGNGIQRLDEFRKLRPELPVIVISARNTIMTAIKVEQGEAFAYLPKPFDLPELLKRVKQALDLNDRITASPKDEGTPDELPLVGRTPAMQTLYGLLAKVINADLPLQLYGESGSGKSLIARVLHDYGDRRGLPFVSLDFGAIGSPTELASIFSKARGGTILFDEVGDLDAASQLCIVRALDALAGKPPRLLATSQHDLHGKMDAGTFRKDLYYRLCGASVPVPPLRDRIDDIPLLVDHFLVRAEQSGFSLQSISRGGLNHMRRYGWPGNVRQLENVVQRLAATSSKIEVSEADVVEVLATQPSPPENHVATEKSVFSNQIASQVRRHFEIQGSHLPPRGLYLRVMREVEEPLIQAALEATDGNRSKCAELLGINRNTLRKKIQDLGIRTTRRRRLS